MKAASIDDLKKELKELPSKKVLELLLRIARFKKENKELLTYLLFESENEQGYVHSLQLEIDEQFSSISWMPVSQTKKQLRKIVRLINRQIKYIGSKAAAVELLLHFSLRLRENEGKALHPKLSTILQQQINKAEKLLPLVDEDLQFDYLQRINSIRGTDAPFPVKKKWWRQPSLSSR